MCVCLFVYDEAKGGKFYRLLHTFKCNYPKIVQESV